jgi:hypothetical protein
VDSSVAVSIPSRLSWRPCARTALIRTFTIQTVLRRAPGWEGVRGAGVHHLGVLHHVDRSHPLIHPLVFLIVDNLRPRVARRGHLLCLTGGTEAGCRGSRPAGTRPGILTGVLKTTLRDPQVETPAPG